MRSFVEDLSTAVAELVARHQDPEKGARPFRVATGLHPAPDSEEGGAW